MASMGCNRRWALGIVGDPLLDMHALEHVVFVMKGGVIEKQPPPTR